MKNKKQITIAVSSVLVVLALVLTVVLLIKPSFADPKEGASPVSDENAEVTKNQKDPDLESAEDITVMQLVSDPEKYDGKLVRITGFCFLEYNEGDHGIFASQNDYYGQTGNAVQIKYETNSHFAGTFGGGYVLAEGVFDRSDRGEKDTFCGVLKNIRRCELWDKEKRCSLSQFYTITSNVDYTVTYKIKDKDGKVMLTDTASRSRFIYQVNENVLAYWGAGGTGFGTRWAVFCDVETGIVTEIKGSFLVAQGDYVVLSKFENGAFFVVVQDIFSPSRYCKMHMLDNPSPSADVICAARLNGEGKAIVTYLTGDDYQEKEMEISFP
ncbi:MAG: hypothetical protein E7580_00065 [Ruminococcaceae bacterium]|nr:hypothetical protein [Oscillospiraceae bacterium]